MKVLQLSSKNIEISETLPKQYSKMILNSMIAKSLENGELIKELSLHLDSKELEKIVDKLKINTFNKVKVQIPKQPKIKTLKEKVSQSKQIKKEEEESIFYGFNE